MKKEYVKPHMYAEKFIPNEYASGCKPGVDENNAEPYYAECWYKNHGWTGCSNNGETVALLTDKNSGCQIKLTASGKAITSSGIEECMHDFEMDGIYGQVPAYRWDNGMHGWHYIPKTEFGGKDSETGLPIYFNS